MIRCMMSQVDRERAVERKENIGVLELQIAETQTELDLLEHELRKLKAQDEQQ